MKNPLVLVMVSFALAISPVFSGEEDRKSVSMAPSADSAMNIPMAQQAVTPPPSSSPGGRQDPLTNFVFGVKVDVPEQTGYFKSAGGLTAETETTDHPEGGVSHTKPLFAAPAQKIHMSPPALDRLKTKFEGLNLMEEKVSTAGQVTEVKVVGYDETKTKVIIGDGAKLGGRLDGSFKEPAAIEPVGFDVISTTKRTETTYGSYGLVSGYTQEIKDDTTLTLQTEPEPKVSYSRATPIPVRLRAEGNEASAISSLRTLVSSQAMFYQGDVEADGTYDYGKNFEMPKTGGMIDNVLGGSDQKAQDTKYTMFMPGGTPARATTELKMTELEGTTKKGEAKTPPQEDSAAADSGKDEDDESK
jgi:hypothetical protein